MDASARNGTAWLVLTTTSERSLGLHSGLHRSIQHPERRTVLRTSRNGLHRSVSSNFAKVPVCIFFELAPCDHLGLTTTSERKVRLQNGLLRSIQRREPVHRSENKQKRTVRGNLVEFCHNTGMHLFNIDAVRPSWFDDNFGTQAPIAKRIAAFDSASRTCAPFRE